MIKPIPSSVKPLPTAKLAQPAQPSMLSRYAGKVGGAVVAGAKAVAKVPSKIADRIEAGMKASDQAQKAKEQAFIGADRFVTKDGIVRPTSDLGKRYK